MKTKLRIPYRRIALILALCSATANIVAGQQVAEPAKTTPAVSAGFKDFSTRVDEYMKLRQSIEKKLPPLKSKEELPEMITAHQLAMARKLREARPNAEDGDIFTKLSRETFKSVIREVFKDPGTKVKNVTTKQRDAIKPLRLKVNENYPNALAETNFPSALLEKLPILPEELSYRIVERDLILVDTKASLVIDILHESIPKL